MDLRFPLGTVMEVLSFAAIFLLQFTSLSGLSADGCEDRLLSWSGHTFHVRRCPYPAPGAEIPPGVSDSQQVTRVPITVRLLGDFMEDLKNDSSTTYINFTEEFNKAVTSMFKDVQSFVGVEIQHYSAGSIVVEFDIIIQEEIVQVDEVIDVVSVIASALASSNSTLGNFTVGEVAFVADDNTTSAVTPCDCGQLNCVSVLGDCVAFCSSNINYCFNGGICRSNRSTALVCECLGTQDVLYTGERCENEVVITRSPPTTRADTESPSENWTVFVTTVDMTIASQEPKTASSAKTTVSSTSARGIINSTVLPTTRTSVLRDSTIVPTTGTAAANVSVPSSPKSGPVPSSECTFPFEYNGTMYHECTATDSSRPWCAWDSVFQYSRWGYCEVHEPEEPECSFPFVYHGNYYFSCTTENSYGRPWCAYDTMYRRENWRHCDGSEEVQEPEQPEETQCAFPFVYKGNIYYSCTTEDSMVPWCAKDRLYQPDRWVICTTSKTTDSEHTEDRVVPDKRCKSQFWYKDERFTGCTDQDSLYPWCAWDVTYQKGRWSVCDSTTGKDTDGSGDFSGSGSGDEREGSAVPPKDEDDDAWLWDDTSCHIPFVYKGKTYSGCTMKDSLIPWCSVDPVFQPGRWAFCKDEQSKSQPPRDDDKPSEATEESRGQCVFPFYYNGVLYTGCTMVDFLTPWCAWDRMYRKNRWSYCEKALPEPPSVVGRPHDCVFPFHYGGHWNYDCIVSESGRPWCPWDQYYRTGRYSFCDTDKKNNRPPSGETSGESDMSGSGEEIECTIPFYYNGVLYNRCALVDSLLPWCAWDKTFQEGRWSLCNATHDQDNYSGDDTSGTGSGEDMENILCTFPFFYKHKEYAECTMDDSLIPWCAWDKVFKESRWSYCDKGLTSKPPNKKERPDKCVFPFNYHGQWHDDCAAYGTGLAWCAWDAVYVPGRFSVCDTDKNEGSAEGSGTQGSGEGTSGSGAEIPCVFPFKYKGIWYEDCSRKDSPLPWCAWDAEFKPGRWAVCDWINKTTDGGTGNGAGESDEDQSNPWTDGEDAWLWDETSCVFPFMYKGVLYQKCTTHDSSHPWCSVDAIYQHGSGRWAYCKTSDDDSTKFTQTPVPCLRDPRCVFPFYYKEKWHSDCTMENSIIPWCAWDYVLENGRWSYCQTTEQTPAHNEGSGLEKSPGEDMSGSGDETPCVFPFRYHGIWYSGCTLVDSVVPWCAWDRDYEEGRYTVCTQGRKTTNKHPTEASEDSEVSGSGDEEKCSFPFMYGGVLYTGCTKVDSAVPWCAWDRHYLEGRYSICKEVTEVSMTDGKDEKDCVFPFTYSDEEYASCTTEDSEVPWCAWDKEYQFGRWSYCENPVQPTSSLPTVPADCVFPFYYKGQRFDGCTSVGYILPWCAWDQAYTDGRWSVCQGKPSEEPTRPSDEHCVFPFVYGGSVFTQCTSVNSSRPWCSWDSLHTVGRWSYCECTFPFQYQGRTYHRCTTDDWPVPWCALDSQYLPHRWITCTDQITTTVKPSKTTTFRPKKTTTPEVFITTEVVTSAPRTDVEFVTDFFIPTKTNEVKDEFSTQETIQDTTINMAQGTVTELLPDVTEQVTMATKEATTSLVATSVGTNETTTKGVEDSTQVSRETTVEPILVTTAVMEVQTTVETLEETSAVTKISETTSSRSQTDVPLITTDTVEGSPASSGQTATPPTTVQVLTSSAEPVSTSVVMPETTPDAMETTTNVTQATSPDVVDTSPVMSPSTSVVVDGSTSTTKATTSAAVQDITTSAETTTAVEGTTRSSFNQKTTTVEVQGTTASVSQTTSFAAEQGTTASVDQTTSSMPVQGTAASVGQTTSSVAGQVTTASVGQMTSSVPVQGTTSFATQTTSSVPGQGTTFSVDQTTSTVSVQGTTTSVGQTTSSVPVQGTTTSVGQTASSVPGQGTTASVGLTTSSVPVQGTTTSVGQTASSVPGQGTTASVGLTTSSVPVQGTTTSVGQTSPVAGQGTTASVGQTASSVAVQGTSASVGQTASSVAVQGTTASVDQTSSVAEQGTTASVGRTTSSFIVQSTKTSLGQTSSAVVQSTTTPAILQETTSAMAQGTTTTLGAVQETNTPQTLTIVSQGTSTAGKSTATPSEAQPTTSRQDTTTSAVAKGTTSTTLRPSTQKPTTKSSTTQTPTSSTLEPTQNSTTQRLMSSTLKPTTQSISTQGLTTVPFPVTTAVTSAVAIEVQITSQNFTQELTNSNTAEYQQLAQELIDYLSQLYADVPGFQGIVINGFREGSVIAEFDVILVSQEAVSPQEIGSVLQTAVENTDNTLGNFVVGRLSLAVEGNFTEMSPCSNREGCGNGIKCTKIGDECMAFCRTNPGYCYNGAQCSDSANDHLTCLCSWNLWRYYSGDRCQNVDTSIILYIIIGSCAGGLLIILTAASWIAIMVKRSRNKSFPHSVGNTPDPGREGSIRGYGYSKDPFMRSLAEMLEQNGQDGHQVWNKQVGHTNESFLYQPEDQRADPEEDRRIEENQQNLLSKMRIYDAQVHDGMQTMSSAGSQDITIHFPARPSRPRDDTRFSRLHTYNPRFLEDVHL
ncbi:uncharacterized protein LOC144910713 [Branchiostoma floridae x Branchiostoma belcheri]